MQVDILCCFNVQIYMSEQVIQIQNAIWNTCVGLGSLRDILCRFVKVYYHWTTQLSRLYWPQTLRAMYRNISKMADQSGPVNPRMHYVVLTVTSCGCLNLYLNPWKLELLHMLNRYHICLNTTKYLIFNMQYFRNWLCISILDWFGHVVFPLQGRDINARHAIYAAALAGDK